MPRDSTVRLRPARRFGPAGLLAGLLTGLLTGLLAGLLGAPLSVAPASASAAAPPSRPDCLPLALGSTGLPLVGGQIPSFSAFTGGGSGFGPVAGPEVSLPERVVFTDGTEAVSTEYAFALRDGDLYVRRATAGTPVADSSWHALELPACLQGRVARVSADQRLITVLDTDGQLYSHDMPGGDLSPERWTWRWGPYLWLGAGMQMFPGVIDWAISDFHTSETFTDTAGTRQHPLGVATGYLLRADRRTITYIDPWLPADQSREVCGPRRGRLALASLDASGSTVLVAGTDGSLWTRLYDFDLAGGNSLLGKYTWQPHASTAGVWQLPAPGWIRQPQPRGSVTDLVTIVRTGPDAGQRELRVEGRDRRGRTGYWHKGLNAPRWRFTRTHTALLGRPLQGKARLKKPLDRRYVGTIGGHRAVVKDFHPACSGSTVVVRFPGGAPLRLRLQAEDALRQVERARGLDDVPRSYNAALTVPRQTWRTRAAQPAPVRAFLERQLSGRVTEFPMTATRTRLRMRYQCWELTLDGRPAAADRPGNPLDLGQLLGFLRDAPAQKRLPRC